MARRWSTCRTVRFLAGAIMGVIESFVLLVGKWFGYVGACVFVPDATCRPFLAFFALGAAACAALTLVVMAYRATQQRDMVTPEASSSLVQTTSKQERPRRPVPEQKPASQPALQPRLRAAA